jgi:Ser/Thr protein kinase RdoA (MazF antagonist)
MDELAPHWPQAIYDFLEWHPQAMSARAADSQDFTVIHSDVNPGNVFAPRQGDCPRFIGDRQPFDWGFTVWPGVYDLAYAIIPR